MSRNVWRRLFGAGVIEASEGGIFQQTDLSWLEVALALIVVGGAVTILCLLSRRAVPWDLPAEPLLLRNGPDLLFYTGTPQQELALVGKILTALRTGAFVYVLRHLLHEVVMVVQQECWWTRGYTVGWDGETVYDVARLVYQAHGEEQVTDDLVEWIQDANNGRMMLDGTILRREVFLRRGWRLIVPAPPEPSPSPYTGQLLNATLLGSAAAFLAGMGWYLLQHHG
jgi:hypothetical protein